MNLRRMIGIILIVFSNVVFIDQLGSITNGLIPIGGFLPSLGPLDIIVYNFWVSLVIELIGWWLIR